MWKLTLALPLLLLAPAAGRAADADFNAIVRGVESDLGIRHMRLPFVGFMVKVAASGHGVHQLDFAVFDEVHYSRPDGEKFDRIVKSAVGNRWVPFVRVRSRRDNEYTYIYVKPDAKNWQMLVASFEPDEATIVHLKLDPGALLEDLDNPASAGAHVEKRDK